MRWLADAAEDSERVADVIRAAGGRVVGRTRLQKMFYLLTVSGLETAFPFEYRHYGPYSEKLTRATSNGSIKGTIQEVEHSATWGGTYSIFTAEGSSGSVNPALAKLLRVANDADPIDLELAATAIFLSKEGVEDPWSETLKRKPEKAHKVNSAKELLRILSRLDLPKRIDIGHLG